MCIYVKFFCDIVLISPTETSTFTKIVLVKVNNNFYISDLNDVLNYYFIHAYSCI